ncbi:MAG: hypothetical protein RLZZ399_63 [Verrucomicrobiota bacterium]|jgi:hypothetical protein
MFHRLLALAPIALLSLSLSAAAEEQALFNGKDLTGWKGNLAVWSVRDGVIRGESQLDPARAPKSKLHENTFLVWTGGTPKDFELRLKARFLSVWGNSGIQFRSAVVREGKDGPIVKGYQAEFETEGLYSGGLYEERRSGILAKRGERVVIRPHPDHLITPQLEVTGSVGNPDEIQSLIRPHEWNDYVIIAKGDNIRLFINGKQTAEVTDKRPKAPLEGIIALQVHHQEPMTVEFKDIYLTEEP